MALVAVGNTKKHTHVTVSYWFGQIVACEVMIITFYLHASIICHVLQRNPPRHKYKEQEGERERDMVGMVDTNHAFKCHIVHSRGCIDWSS